MHPALKPLFKDHGTSPAAEALMQGKITAELKSFLSPVRNVLRCMARTDEEPQLSKITGNITTAEFKAAFKAVAEKTSSSSPSGIYYTLWKAIATDNEL